MLNRPEITARIDLQRKVALFRRLRYDALWVQGALDCSGSFPDPKDDFLLSGALEGEAEFILTWDAALLKTSESRGVRILSSESFIPLILRLR